MKRTSLFCAASLFSMTAFSQTPNTFPATGTAGIGTTTPSSTFNAQVHGTTDYTVTFPGQPGYWHINGSWVPGTSGGTTNYGKTGRIGLTNTTCGATGTDGTIIRQSGLEFAIENLEKNMMTFQSGNALLRLDGATNKVNIGSGTFSSGTAFGALNVLTSVDNGMTIETLLPTYFGLKVKVKADTDYAVKFFGSNATTEAFSVKGSGEIYSRLNSTVATDKVFTFWNTTRKLLQLTNDGILRSREIIVDAQNWADYVFDPTYKLRSLDEVKEYIAANGHLPNVPSTSEVNENGVNLVKTDAILLEKIEELTLYILQLKENNEALEERLKVLEASN